MVLLANNLLASAMFAIGCGLLTAIMLRRSYRYFGRSRKKNEGPIATQPRPTSEWAGAYADSSARIEREKVEMHELGRELKAQLDNKIIVLKQLCAQSQRQIERMEQLLEECSRREG